MADRFPRQPLWAADSPTLTLTIDGVPPVPALPVWVARTGRERRQGLLGTDPIQGAVWLTKTGSVHCVGMRYPIDVLYLDRHCRVLRVSTMRPGVFWHVAPWGTRSVVEMCAGTAGALGIVRGRHLGFVAA